VSLLSEYMLGQQQAHSLGMSIQEAERLADLRDDGEATSQWSGERLQEGWWVGDFPGGRKQQDIATPPRRTAWQAENELEAEEMSCKG